MSSGRMNEFLHTHHIILYVQALLSLNHLCIGVILKADNENWRVITVHIVQ